MGLALETFEASRLLRRDVGVGRATRRHGKDRGETCRQADGKADARPAPRPLLVSAARFA
jgi:hypothetical protein